MRDVGKHEVSRLADTPALDGGSTIMRHLTLALAVLAVGAALSLSGCAGTRCCRRNDARLLTIEWRHLVVDGNTCLRCGETGRALDSVVVDLGRELAPRGVKVAFNEVKLGPERIAESNSILFNGESIEAVLPDLEVTYTSCQSCCGMVGKPVECRAVVYRGKTYDEVPEAAIRAAALKAAGLPAEPAPRE